MAPSLTISIPLSSLPLSHFSHIENEILGNPPFCWDLWVSVFCSEVHSKYFH